MKKLVLILLLAGIAAGCRTRYDITLSNNVRLTNITKPTLDKATGQYRFKDSGGKEYVVSRTRVRVIEPHDRYSTDEASKFKAPSRR
jgi:hypothetical protein